MDAIKFIAFSVTQAFVIVNTQSTSKVTQLQASYKVQYVSSTPRTADLSLLIWSISAPENSTLFVKIGPHLEETKCVSFFAEIIESTRPGTSSTKPRLTQFCPEPDGPSGVQVDRFYRSQSSSLSILYYKSSDIEMFSLSYQIDDCVCRKGPDCKEPCICPFNYGGRDCSTRTCTSPAVAHAALVLYPRTGFSENNKFSVGSVISFHCDDGYKRKGAEYMTCTSSGFVGQPPSCVKEEHFFQIRCKNRYNDPYYDNQLPVRVTDPPYNRINAQYDPIEESYPVETLLRFRCSHGYYLEDTFELSEMVTYCGNSGEWSVPWPKCQGIVCPKPTLRNGQVRLAGSIDASLPPEITVGTRLELVCDPGFYRIGARSLTCMKYRFWDKQVPECVDQDVFRNRCTMSGKQIKFKPDEYGGLEVPYCASESGETGSSSVSLNTLTVVTASAATVFGVLLLVIALVAYQRRRILREIRRARRRRSASEVPSESGQLQFNFSSTFHFVLPSYDEAMRSRPDTGPPSFDEAMQGSTCGPTNVSLPPYSSAAAVPASNEFAGGRLDNLPVYVEDDADSFAGDTTTCDLIYQALSADDVVEESELSSAIDHVPIVECRRVASLSSGDSSLSDNADEESRLL